MKRHEPIPTIRIEGPPRQRGEQYGEQARERIARNIQIYDETFRHYTTLSWDEVRGKSREFLPPIKAFDPQMIEELEGIAAGANRTFEDLLALNVRTEIMMGLKVAAPAECTSFAVERCASADGHTYIGQNWDWRPAAHEVNLLLEIAQERRPNVVTMAEAGLLAKIGMNSAGVGLTANLLLTDQDRGEQGLPFHCILRGILNASTLSEAIQAITFLPRSASANYLIAREGFAVDIEVGPGGVDRCYFLHPEEGVLAHANMFCSGEFCFKDLARIWWPDSLARKRNMGTFLKSRAGRIKVEDLQEFLRDHFDYPNSICRHPDAKVHPLERSESVASLIMELEARRLWITPGNPCCHEYECLEYGVFLAGVGLPEIVAPPAVSPEAVRG